MFWFFFSLEIWNSNHQSLSLFTMKFDFFRVDIWVEKINSSKFYRKWTCWVSHRRHHSSLVKCSQIHIVWMHHVKVFYVFICSFHDFNAAAFVFFHIFLKRFLCGCSCVRIWKKKIRQIRIEGNEKGETEKKWFKRAKLWGSRSLNWREPKKKKWIVCHIDNRRRYEQNREKNREQIQKSKEISAVNRCRQRWQRQREREKKHVRITMIPLFCTEIDMKSIKIYSWSNEKLCVLNSFDRFFLLFFHLVLAFNSLRFI